MTKKSFLLLLLLDYYRFVSFIQISYRSKLLETKSQTIILRFFIFSYSFTIMWSPFHHLKSVKYKLSLLYSTCITAMRDLYFVFVIFKILLMKNEISFFL